MQKISISTGKRKVLKRLAKVSLTIFSTAVLIGSSAAGAVDSAADPESAMIAAEGGKQALNEALKLAKTKPALSIAASITCLACIPAAGASASASLCVACGILIAKTLC